MTDHWYCAREACGMWIGGGRGRECPGCRRWYCQGCMRVFRSDGIRVCLLCYAVWCRLSWLRGLDEAQGFLCADAVRGQDRICGEG